MMKYTTLSTLLLAGLLALASCGDDSDNPNPDCEPNCNPDPDPDPDPDSDPPPVAARHRRLYHFKPPVTAFDELARLRGAP